MDQALHEPVGVLDEGRVPQEDDEQVRHQGLDVRLLHEIHQHGRHLAWQVRVPEDVLNHQVLEFRSQVSVMPIREVLNPDVVPGGVHEVGLPEIQEVRPEGQPQARYKLLLP